MAEVFRPSRLATVQEFCGGEVFQIFVVGNNIDGGSGTFKVVTPDAERFEDSEEFFVMDVIVEFGRREGAGKEADRVNFTIFTDDQ